MYLDIIDRPVTRWTLNCELVDILRQLSRLNYTYVKDYLWLVAELDFYSYGDGMFGPEALSLMFPEFPVDSERIFVVVTGERLMERSALVHQFDTGSFVRLPTDQVRSEVPDSLIWGTSHDLERAGISLSIRCTDARAYRIYSTEEDIIRCAKEVFTISEIDD